MKRLENELKESKELFDKKLTEKQKAVSQNDIETSLNHKDGKLTRLERQVDESDAMIQANNAKISDLQGQLLAEAASALESTQQLETTIHAKEEEVGQLNVDLTRVTASANRLQNELKTATSELALLEELAQNDIEESDAIIQAKTAKISGLQEKIMVNEENVLAVRQQLEANIRTKEDQVDQLKADLTRVSADANNLQLELNSMTALKDAVASEIAALEEIIDDTSNEYEDIIKVKEAKISDLQDQMVGNEASTLEAR